MKWEWDSAGTSFDLFGRKQFRVILCSVAGAGRKSPWFPEIIHLFSLFLLPATVLDRHRTLDIFLRTGFWLSTLRGQSTRHGISCIPAIGLIFHSRSIKSSGDPLSPVLGYMGA